MCQWRRGKLDEESVWDEERSISLSRFVNLLRQIEVALANGKSTPPGSQVEFYNPCPSVQPYGSMYA